MFLRVYVNLPECNRRVLRLTNLPSRFSIIINEWLLWLLMVTNGCLVGGSNPSEKYEFVSWDDEIPNIWKNESHVPVTTNQ